MLDLCLMWGKLNVQQHPHSFLLTNSLPLSLNGSWKKIKRTAASVWTLENHNDVCLKLVVKLVILIILLCGCSMSYFGVFGFGLMEVQKEINITAVFVLCSPSSLLCLSVFILFISLVLLFTFPFCHHLNHLKKREM